MQQSILNHARSRYLWVAVALCVASLVAYVLHRPGGPPNGGTWLGYTLGTIGALLIVWLMGLGVRKRRYANSLGTLRGWLSAHVYLGTALILVALLHCGFQFGWNIHTLCFALMTIVIISGFFGVYAYLRYPALMTRNRDSATRDAMLEEIAELDRNALSLADGVDPKLHAVLLRSIDNTRLGGNAWRQLRRRDTSDAAIHQVRKSIEARETALSIGATGATNPAAGQTIFAVVDYLAAGGDQHTGALRKLIDLLSRKKALAERIGRDIQYQALMEIWLYIHVPLSFALLAALIAHIVSVFFYW